MSEQSKLGWGILGAARINRRLIPGLQAASNAQLLGLASRDAAKGQAAIAQWNIPQLYPTYEALLADPAIRAVYLPLPNALHTEWIIKSLAAGKAVLCEKPLAITVEEVRQVEAASQAVGLPVMEAFMYRFHPQQARVRERLTAGEIGEARVLRGTFAFGIAPGPNIRLDKDLGGGATWDVGCYGINVARWMFGVEPRQVMAQATIQNGIDYSAAVLLDFGDQRRAVLDYGINYARRSFYELIGTQGSLTVENMWQEPDQPATIYLRTDASGLSTEQLPPTSHFQLEVEAFSQAVLDGQPSPYPLSDTAANVRVCNAVLEAIRTGQPVNLT